MRVRKILVNAPFAESHGHHENYEYYRCMHCLDTKICTAGHKIRKCKCQQNSIFHEKCLEEEILLNPQSTAPSVDYPDLMSFQCATCKTSVFYRSDFSKKRRQFSEFLLVDKLLLAGIIVLPVIILILIILAIVFQSELYIPGIIFSVFFLLGLIYLFKMYVEVKFYMEIEEVQRVDSERKIIEYGRRN